MPSFFVSAISCESSLAAKWSAACAFHTPGDLFVAVEILLKGKEIDLPEGYFFRDKDGHVRHAIRARWYLPPDNHRYRTYALQSDRIACDAPLDAQAVAAAAPYPGGEKPIFVGHYWLDAIGPAILASNVACLDYSVAKGGFLCGYRWDGEQSLNDARFLTSRRTSVSRGTLSELDAPRPVWELVVTVGFEGGGSRIFRAMTQAGGWQYFCDSMGMWLNLDDTEEVRSSRQGPFESLESALNSVGKNNLWILGSPMDVRPESRAELRQLIRATQAGFRGECGDGWIRLCQEFERAHPDQARPPLQNRVNPWGQMIAHPARGQFMGNRGGCFHNDQKQLTGSRWKGRAWIICQLSFKDRHRDVMTPGLYTELFFLDEATALAAGHRPCKECRREDHMRFKEAWTLGNLGENLPKVSIKEVDARLHQERVIPHKKTKVTYRAMLHELPEGTIVSMESHWRTAMLIWDGMLWPWWPAGYGEPYSLDSNDEVTVLTPRSTVAALKAGYRPQVAIRDSRCDSATSSIGPGQE